MSWKKYGGTNKYDQLTNLSVHNLVTDSLSIKGSYLGNFTICGELIIEGLTNINNDFSVSGNLFAIKNLFVLNSMGISKNADICNNLKVYGNTFLYKPLYLVGPNGEGMRFDVNTEEFTGNMFLIGNAYGVGMNKTSTPESILDIFGNRSEIINVKSSNLKSRNILVRNNQNSGIVLSVDNSASSLEFYHSDLPINSINDIGIGGGSGRIWYEPGGDIKIDTTKNLTVLSKFSVSNRTDQRYSHVNNEAAVIYDNSSSVFLQNEYHKSNVYSGTALSLISTDNSSNTFLYISNPNSMGWKWGAGIYPTDSTRNMGIMGWNDICNNNTFVPSEIVVSGNSHIKNRSTIGINKYTPNTEDYVLDINGPIHINHNEIHLIADVSFQVLSMSFSKINSLYGIAVGTSLNIRSPFSYAILYTQNGGDTWIVSQLIDSIRNLSSANVSFQCFYYDTSHAIVSSNSQFTYYSMNGGVNWNYVDITKNTSTIIPFANTIPHIYSSNITNSNIFLFLSYSKYTSGNKNYPSIVYYYDQSYNYIGYIDSSLNTVNDIYGVNNTIYLVGDGLETYSVIDGSPDYLRKIYYTSSLTYTYKSVKTIQNGTVIAVGSNTTSSVISYSTNSGNTWKNKTITNVILNDVFIWDSSNSIIVGNSGVIYYSTDAYQTWNRLTIHEINSMGNGYNLLDTTQNISRVSMSAVDTFIFSCVVSTFVFGQTNGRTNMYTVYLPNLFNRSAHAPLFDISGNMEISGDIHINDDGKLQSNNDTFYILDDTVQSVYFAGDASNIHIGNAISGGTTYIRHQLDVSDNSRFHSNVIINGIETITNTTESTGLNTGALCVFGGTSINANVIIGGNAVIYCDISLNGNQVTQGNLTVRNNTDLGTTSSNDLNVYATSHFFADVSMDMDLFVNGDVSLNSKLYVNGDVSLNSKLYVNKDVSLNSKLYVNGDVSANNRLFLGQDASFNAKLYVNGDVSVNSHLFVGNDVSFNSNLFVNKDISINNHLYVGNNALFNANIYANGDISANNRLFVGKDVSLNAKLFVNGDISANNRLFVNQDAVLNANLFIRGDISANSRLFVGQDTSLNANLFVNGDVSANNRLFVNKNASLNANLFVNGDVSANSRLFVGQDTSLNANLFVNGVVSANSSLFVGDDTSLNANLFINGDVSANSRLFVGNDTSLNANLYVNGVVSANSRLIVGNDASLNANLYVNGAISTNNGLFVRNDASLNANIYVNGDISANSRLFVGKDVSLNANLSVNNNVSVNNHLFVLQDASINANLFVNGDISANSRLFVGQDVSLNANLSVNKDISVNNHLFVGQDVSLNANLYVKNQALFDNTGANSSFTVNSNAYFNNDTTMHSVNVLNDISLNGNLKTNNIDSEDSLNICGTNSTVSSINIGISDNVSKIITIGGKYDNIQINGTTNVQSLQYVNQQVLNIDSKNIILNRNGLDYNSSRQAGITIYDISGGNANAGLIIVSDDMSSMVFKSTGSNNIVALKMPNLVPSFTNDKKNNILMLQTSDMSDSSYCIVSSNIDISSILWRDNVNSDSNNQIINSDLAILGNLMINKNSTSIMNAAMDISGNAIVSRLGIATSEVNSSASLDISGEIHHLNGWVIQF